MHTPVLTPTDLHGSGFLIPAPALIRDRLYRLRTEARLLARLLRLSEDHARLLPTPGTDRRPAGGAPWLTPC